MSHDAPVTATLSGIHHVKLPVSDVAASRDWYQRVLGFQTELDFMENGRLMGVGLIQPESNLRFALREAPDRARGMQGFDPIAWAVDTREDLDRWVAQLEEMGVAHGPVIKASIGWIVTLSDPDGYEVKLYTRERP